METSQGKSEKEQVIDFIKLCFHHWYYFVISGIICLALGFIYLKIKTPVYSVVSQVTLTKDENLAGGGVSRSSGLLSAFGVRNGNDNIEDETLKLKSQGNIKDIVKNLELNKTYQLSKFGGFLKTNLYEESPIRLEINPTIGDTLSRTITINLNLKNNSSTSIAIKYGKEKEGQYEITQFPAVIKTTLGELKFSVSEFYPEYKDKNSTLIIKYSNYDYMAQNYRNSLNIDFHKKTSDLINLALNSENPPFAKRVLKAIINNYNKNWVLDKEYNYNKTIQFINDRLKTSKEELDNADKNIQNFKNKYNLTNIEADVAYYFKMNGELQSSLLGTETKLQLIYMINDFLNKEENKYSLIPFSLATSDPSITHSIEKYNEELLRRNEIAKSNTKSAFTESLESQLESLRKNLILSLKNIQNELTMNLSTLRERDAQIKELMGNVPTIEYDYLSLRREQVLQQTMYTFLLEKREEAAIKYASFMPKLKVVDEAYTKNKPVSPSLKNIALMILFFGGIIIPISLIYLVPYFRKTK